MKKLIPLFIAALATLAGCSNKDKQPDDSILWKITGPGLDEPSYIVAKTRFTQPSTLDHFPSFEVAFESCTQLAVRVDESDPENLAEEYSRWNYMPEGLTYYDLMSEADVERLDVLFNLSTGLTGDMLRRYRPVVASSLFASMIYFQTDHTYDVFTQPGLDTYLPERAEKEGKEIIGLLNTQEIMEIMAPGESFASQAAELLCLLENRERLKAHLIETGELMSQGRIHEQYRITHDASLFPCHQEEQYYREIYRTENALWLERLPAIMRAGATMIVAHVDQMCPEGYGIIEGLRNLGYEVTPVK